MKRRVLGATLFYAFGQTSRGFFDDSGDHRRRLMVVVKVHFPLSGWSVPRRPAAAAGASRVS